LSFIEATCYADQGVSAGWSISQSVKSSVILMTDWTD
jgi:hypothetical protein